VRGARQEEYKQRFARIEQSVLATLNEYAKIDPTMMRHALEEARMRPHATLGLARALTGEIYRNKARPLDTADASDLMHAVVPCAYCDFVLLDGKWCHYIDQACRCLEDAGEPKQHFARVYSRRHDGVRRFLDDLRAHPGDPRSDPPWPASVSESSELGE
jgi:hypothetical protein